MSRIKRRHFLQLASSTLAAIGLSHLDIQHQGLRYARVLAQSTPRKCALLVGINDYPDNLRFTPLKGCVTDVELQKELLVRRFRFSPNDIFTLTDDTPDKPTRDNILAYFEEYLIKPSQSGDVIVFHFSGHGDRVLDPDPIRDENGRPLPNATFVPADAQLNLDDNTVSDIMGKTLFLLMRQLTTENVTVILDSCHSGGGTRGNVRIRSAQSQRDLNPSELELEYQRRWLGDLTPEDLMRLRQESVATGIVIASAQRHQRALDVAFDGLAADGTFSGFDAGVFTYFMTQYLWQQTASAEGMIAQVNRSLQAAHFAQEPLVDAKVGSGFERQPAYFVSDVDAAQVPPAEAVIRVVSGNRATIWLGGIDHSSMVAFDQDATLTPVGTDSPMQVRILSRSGLYAEVELPASLQPGTLLQESSRVIPGDLKLRIGLDLSLDNETPRAQALLQRLRRMEPVPAEAGNTPYAGEVQYILSRMTEAYRAAFLGSGVSAVPGTNSIGLFSQSLDEIIPGSFAHPEEPIEEAIARLQPKLTALVAARLVKLTLNANSSRLNVEAIMRVEGQAEDLIGEAFTVRGGATARAGEHSLHQLSSGDRFQFQITNRASQDLFLSIWVVGSSGDIAVLFPNPYAAGTPQLKANESILIPDPNKGDNFEFFTDETGVGEALIIVSRSPLQRAIQRLNNLAIEQQAEIRGAFVTPTDEAIADLLADLSDTRSGSVSTTANPQIRTSEIAALSITFAVI